MTEQTLLTEAPVLSEAMDEVAYENSVQRGKAILADRDTMKWELGDIILEWAGAPGSDVAGLRKVAADIGITEAYATMLRLVAYTFPSDRRRVGVPWKQHHHLITEHELATTMLERYEAHRDAAGPQRVNSNRLMDEVVNEVRREHRVMQRTPRTRTPVDEFTRMVRRFHRKWNRNQIPLASTAEVELLLEELENLKADIERAF